jgi:predicted nucleic acid-binding Zn ribbon protein
MGINSRSTKATPLKEAIDEFLKSFKLTQKYNETYVIAHWEQIMGKSIATRTEKIFVKNGVLYLKISSAPLRSELLMAKSKMIKLLNQEMQNELIKEVVFI